MSWFHENALSCQILNYEIFDLGGWEMEMQAHALGAVRGHIYTNSQKAFESSYRNGFRRFEVDINPTADGVFVCSHDVKRLSHQTHAEFMSDIKVGIQDQGPGFYVKGGGAMDLHGLHRLLECHKDARLMIDFQPAVLTPENHDIFVRFIRALCATGIDVSRLSIEIISEEQLKILAENSLGAIPWLSSKTEKIVLPMLKSGKVKNVSVDRSLLTEGYVQMLHAYGLRIFSPGWDSYKDYGRAERLGIDVITTHYTRRYRFLFYYLRVLIYGTLNLLTFCKSSSVWSQNLKRVLSE